jgi:hypothetical protein
MRYGYKPIEILNMPYKDYFEQIEILNIGLKDEFLNQMLLQAFGSWQIIETLKAMLGGKNNKEISFEKYAKSLGLIEKGNAEINKKTAQIEAQMALQQAQKIVEMDRKGREKQQ